MSEVKFYVCKHCGNIVVKVKDSGVGLICCGDDMQELIPNTVDAAKEKHVPVISQEGNIVTVEVGSVAHPMLEEHHIQWVMLETCCGRQRRALKAGDSPKVQFALLEGEKAVAAYEYCNLHGLWKADA